MTKGGPRPLPFTSYSDGFYRLKHVCAMAELWIEEAQAAGKAQPWEVARTKARMAETRRGLNQLLRQRFPKKRTP
jgi:hypothetical protein